MTLFALDPLWNDIYTAGGFWVGVLGTVVGIAGFWIAITQIRETRKAAVASKSAAEAAQKAAEQAITESKDSYERFVGAHAGRLLAELRAAVTSADWKLAAFRVRDLADLFATLPSTGVVSVDDTIREAVADLREFDHTFTDLDAKKATKLPSKVTKEQWKPLLRVLNMKLDRLRAPFRREQHGQSDSRGTAGEGSGDRGQPPDEDQVGTGELAPKGDE